MLILIYLLKHYVNKIEEIITGIPLWMSYDIKLNT